MEKKYNRREFAKKSLRTSLSVGLGGVFILAARQAVGEEEVWQIDPFKCVTCGKCETACVMTPSAVKCVHAYALCGYCDLCGGYLKPDANALDTGAENQMCPTSAIRRKFVEDPYFEYEIEEELCNACGKCVEGCTAFGNGSLHLQVRHDRCVQCNECAIAKACPANAIQRISAKKSYLIKGSFTSD